MAPFKIKFCDSWLKKLDANGNPISEWASYKENKKNVTLMCRLCHCDLNFQSKGLHALLQHSKYEKHRKHAVDILASNQTRLVSEKVDEPSTSNTRSVELQSSKKDVALKAELIWAMKVVCSNFSMASCTGLTETFKSMFPGGVPSHFSLSPQKIKYLITDALGPYFHQQISDDIGTSFYTVCFDETTNVESKKELQIAVRYWSDSKCLVISRHLQTFFIGKADAQTLYEKINNAISNAKLQFSKILMIGSDGPNVNKTVHKLFNDELIATRSHGLVNIGTCHIHIVHNAYLKALQAFGQDASDLTVSVYNYFDGWPSRVEEYAKIQEVHKLPQKKFLKHSPSRWLSFHCAAERLIEQWVGLEQYFLKFIPSNKNKSVINSSSYQKIRALLQCSTMKAQLHLAMSSAEIFTTFTESFQKDEPLIHVLYLQLRDLVAKLAGRICKVVSENQFANHDLFKSENMLPINDVILSDNIKNCLSGIPEKVVPMFMDNVKQHYMASCRYLIDKTMGTCNNPNLIRALKCLHPSNVKTRRSLKDINFEAKQLPINVKDDILADEWKMLQLDMDSTFDGRIDCY